MKKKEKKRIGGIEDYLRKIEKLENKGVTNIYPIIFLSEKSKDSLTKELIKKKNSIKNEIYIDGIRIKIYKLTPAEKEVYFSFIEKGKCWKKGENYEFGIYVPLPTLQKIKRLLKYLKNLEDICIIDTKNYNKK